ncbi:MAG: hypothetical protein ABI559_09570 [Chloroflexota bacterium]
MRFRLLAALAATVFALLLLAAPSGHARAANDAAGLALTATVTYDIKTNADGAVHVTWDATVTDNDPATDVSGGNVTYYATIGLPVLRGATGITANDATGNNLQVDTVDPGGGSIDEGATVHFARGIFYKQTYSFRLTYTLADTRSEAVLVTANYVYLPAIAAGDSATVIINTPSGDPWSTTIDPRDCPQAGNSFACAGSAATTYLAALVEVSQPAAVATTTFDVALKDKTVNVTLTYFQGEGASAAHEQALITAGLPVIEQVYGFDYAGPSAVHISQGGRQSSLGYEGLASCTPEVSCEIVISPVAGDYTLLHELSHMWSNIYGRRWLAEGFAEFVAETAGPQLEPGLVVGSPALRRDPTVPLALDDWGDASSVIGADSSVLAVEDAGYTFSIRFLQEMRDQLGIEALQAVNRNIATSGSTADSRRYMDLLEDATRQDLDNLFETWVFPDTYDATLVSRRDAINRLADLRSRLTDAGLPDDIAAPINVSIRAWDFEKALTAIDTADNNLSTYGELRTSLDSLQSDSHNANLTLPDTVTTALNRFDFATVRTAIDSARQALVTYTSSQRTVDASRSVWQKFGLLGSSPGGAIKDAATSYNRGDFDLSRQQSQHAADLVNDASSVAFRRLLVVAGFLGLISIAILIAVVISRLRDRDFAEN